MDADVVVIGAGAAGLAAARSRGRRKLRVLLLEARDRIGGRVLSHPIAGIATPAELGAELFTDQRNEPRHFFAKPGARRSTWAAMRGFVKTANSMRGRKASRRRRAYSRALAPSRATKAWSSFSGALRTTARCGRPRSGARLRRGLRGRRPAIASVRAIADEIESGTDSTSARPLGGYGPMSSFFATTANAPALCSPCRPACAVSLGAATPSKSRWQTRMANSQPLRARAAIVTLPAGVLRHRGDESEIVFCPSCPHKARGACAYRDGARREGRARVPNGVLGAGHGRSLLRRGFFFIDGQPIPMFWTQLPIRSELDRSVGRRSGRGCPEWRTRVRSHREGALGASGSCSTRPNSRAGSSRAASRTIGAATRLRVAATATLPSAAERARRARAPVGDVAFLCRRGDVERWPRRHGNGAVETGERAAAQAAAALGVRKLPETVRRRSGRRGRTFT